MATSIRILTTNYSGQTATITFSPCSGGTINLGSHVVPYDYVSENYMGDYSLLFADFSQTCTFSIPCTTGATPTPTVIVATATPTPAPTDTPTPTQVPTDTPTPAPATSTPTPLPSGAPTGTPTPTETPIPATDTPTPTPVLYTYGINTTEHVEAYDACQFSSPNITVYSTDQYPILTTTFFYVDQELTIPYHTTNEGYYSTLFLDNGDIFAISTNPTGSPLLGLLVALIPCSTLPTPTPLPATSTPTPTPIISGTTTPTPTISGTTIPTATPTVVSYSYQIDISGQFFNAYDACLNQTVNYTVYSEYPTLNVGNILYTNSNLTSEYGAGIGNYFIIEDGINKFVIDSDVNGFGINSITNCVDVFAPTDTPTPTPLPATSTPTPTPEPIPHLGLLVPIHSGDEACEIHTLNSYNVTTQSFTYSMGTNLCDSNRVEFTGVDITNLGNPTNTQGIWVSDGTYYRLGTLDATGVSFSGSDSCVLCGSATPTPTPTMTGTTIPTSTPTPTPTVDLGTTTPTETPTPTPEPPPSYYTFNSSNLLHNNAYDACQGGFGQLAYSNVELISNIVIGSTIFYLDTDLTTPIFSVSGYTWVIIGDMSASVYAVSVDGSGLVTSTIECASVFAPTPTPTPSPTPTPACYLYVVSADDGTSNKDSYNFFYTRCNGTSASGSRVNDGPSITVCAREGSVYGDGPINISEEGAICGSDPTQVPTNIPTNVPTNVPTLEPTQVPTQVPTSTPTPFPPTDTPTPTPLPPDTLPPTATPTPTVPPTDTPTPTPTFPPADAFISSYCSGVDLYGTYHNGVGGTYSQLIQSNSGECGYVPPTWTPTPPPTATPTPTPTPLPDGVLDFGSSDNSEQPCGVGYGPNDYEYYRTYQVDFTSPRSMNGYVVVYLSDNSTISLSFNQNDTAASTSVFCGCGSPCADMIGVSNISYNTSTPTPEPLLPTNPPEECWSAQGSGTIYNSYAECEVGESGNGFGPCVQVSCP